MIAFCKYKSDIKTTLTHCSINHKTINKKVNQSRKTLLTPLSLIPNHQQILRISLKRIKNRRRNFLRKILLQS